MNMNEIPLYKETTSLSNRKYFTSYTPFKSNNKDVKQIQLKKDEFLDLEIITKGPRELKDKIITQEIKISVKDFLGILLIAFNFKNKSLIELINKSDEVFKKMKSSKKLSFYEMIIFQEVLLVSYFSFIKNLTWKIQAPNCFITFSKLSDTLAYNIWCRSLSKVLIDKKYFRSMRDWYLAKIILQLKIFKKFSKIEEQHSVINWIIKKHYPLEKELDPAITYKSGGTQSEAYSAIKKRIKINVKKLLLIAHGKVHWDALSGLFYVHTIGKKLSSNNKAINELFYESFEINHNLMKKISQRHQTAYKKNVNIIDDFLFI